MADVQLVEHGNGDYSIGAEINGVYVPFATVSGHRVAHYAERAETLAERVESGDEEAEKALDELPVEAASTSKASSGKKGG